VQSLAAEERKMNETEWLKEISAWKLEAKEEDNARYFYEPPGLASLRSGDNCFVIGRKGSGKTAIAEYFNGSQAYNIRIRNLSFKNFPFNDLYKMEDTGFTRPSQYTTIWKFIIYNAICSMMAENEAISGKLANALRHYFEVDLERALAPSIIKLTDATFGMNLLGSGGNLSGKKTVAPNDTSWHQRVDMLERFIDENIDESTYYIIFDELDEDYKDILNIERNTKYFDLLIGLFKATYDLRGRFRSPDTIRPIVFLRDDIYDLIQNQDRNKWDDLAIRLDWSAEALERLLAFRASRARGGEGPLLSLTQIIHTLFSTDSISYGTRGRRRRPLLKHILSRTLMRPRDVVSFTRECARVASERGDRGISSEIIKTAGEQRYSQRLRQEFIDEIHSILPYIEDIFGVLSLMRKQIFEFGEFSARYNAYRSKNKDALTFDEVCKILFHFSVIGNQPSQNTARIFKYEHPSANINFGEKGIIHVGLRNCSPPVAALTLIA
jgi:hypothetical protein